MSPLGRFGGGSALGRGRWRGALHFEGTKRFLATMQSRQLIAFAHRLADAAAQETKPRFRSGTAVDNKRQSGFDPVTDADRSAEQAIRQRISEAYPGHGILGEEYGETQGQGDWRWVLDPVDGTRAFICGVPVWTTLIALEYRGTPILGVIDQPISGERWLGACFPEEDPVLEVHNAPQEGVSGCESLDAAKLMVTDMRPGEYFSADEAKAVGQVSAAAQLTRQGLDSYGFALVASGQMDLVVEAQLQWHDVAAVIPVIKAAGGRFTDWSGNALTAAAKTPLQIIASSSERLTDETIRALQI